MYMDGNLKFYKYIYRHNSMSILNRRKNMKNDILKKFIIIKEMRIKELETSLEDFNFHIFKYVQPFDESQSARLTKGIKIDQIDDFKEDFIFTIKIDTTCLCYLIQYLLYRMKVIDDPNCAYLTGRQNYTKFLPKFNKQNQGKWNEIKKHLQTILEILDESNDKKEKVKINKEQYFSLIKDIILNCGFARYRIFDIDVVDIVIAVNICLGERIMWFSRYLDKIIMCEHDENRNEIFSDCIVKMNQCISDILDLITLICDICVNNPKEDILSVSIQSLNLKISNSINDYESKQI